MNNEKIYRTISHSGGASLALGIVVLVTGIVSGVLMIVTGAKLLKQKYQIPGFYIDGPYEKNQDSISYVADQLRELKKFLEDVGGKKISEQSVQRAVANSNEAASYYSSQLALRKDHDPVTSLTN